MFSEKQIFLIKNFLRGFLWFLILIVAFFLIRTYFPANFNKFLAPFYEQPILIYLIYTLSEVVFGIIPPELFILWAVENSGFSHFILILLLLFILSYLAGILGFYIGRLLSSGVYFRYLRKRFLGKYHTLLNKYGMFLILVAALTPLPYSAISMLVGSLNYSFKKYLFYASSRILRFAIYGIIIWEIVK